MANQRKIIGKIPVYRGNWSSSNAPYHKLNDVTLYGCMFRSKIENNSYQPATIGAGGELVVNENWYLVTSGYESEAIKEDLAFIDNNTNAYNVSRFHSHTGFWEAIEYDESQPAYMEAQQYSAGSKVNLVNYTNHTFVAMKSLTGVQPDINTVTNKFTLEEAVLLVPKKYQLSGIEIGFISSETNKPVFHRYNGGTFTSVDSWTGDTVEKLTELENNISESDIFSKKEQFTKERLTKSGFVSIVDGALKLHVSSNWVYDIIPIEDKDFYIETVGTISTGSQGLFIPPIIFLSSSSLDGYIKGSELYGSEPISDYNEFIIFKGEINELKNATHILVNYSFLGDSYNLIFKDIIKNKTIIKSLNEKTTNLQNIKCFSLWETEEPNPFDKLMFVGLNPSIEYEMFSFGVFVDSGNVIVIALRNFNTKEDKIIYISSIYKNEGFIEGNDGSKLYYKFNKNFSSFYTIITDGKIKIDQNVIFEKNLFTTTLHNVIQKLEERLSSIKATDAEKILQIAEIPYKKDVDLFIFSGQSNMMGACALPPTKTEKSLFCYEYKYKKRLRGGDTGEFVYAQNPAGEWHYMNPSYAYNSTNLDTESNKSKLTNYAANTWFVSAMSNASGDNTETNDFSVYSELTCKPAPSLPPYIAREYAKLGNPCIYSHIAKGGVRIEYFFDEEMVNKYNQLIQEYNQEHGTVYSNITEYNSAINPLLEKYSAMIEDFNKLYSDKIIKSKSFVWHQGEANAFEPADTYKLKLQVLWNKLKENGFDNFLIVRVGYFGADGIINTMKAQEEFCNENNNCYIITRSISYMLYPDQDTSSWFVKDLGNDYKNCRDSFAGYNNNHINEKGFSFSSIRAAYNIDRILNKGLNPELEEENIKGLVE